MFDNWNVDIFDRLLNGNLLNRRTPMQRKIIIPTVMLIAVLACDGVFAFTD
jgi:hypothetical protein